MKLKKFCQPRIAKRGNASEAVKKSTQGPNRKDGWIGEALERNLWKVKHCAISLHKHTSLSTWPIAGNLNERFLKFWKSTRPFGTKLDETNFFTASQLWPEIVSQDRCGLFRENLKRHIWAMSQWVDTLKKAASALPIDCPPPNDPLFKVSEGRPLRSNLNRD